MRQSYFSTNVKAVVQALEVGERPGSESLNDLLDTILERLRELLADETSPERDWRNRVASLLQALSKLTRRIGRPTPSLEELAMEMAV